ncbi:Respiratory supercomplex factor 1, mitochondrial [Puccinia graminis f. sp. tritici]|nr:Respiratory supercomplex factor 1, mitochondrial [Puccinia graminis f. sp. tritici]
MRIYQRDLRIRSQEQASRSDNLPKPPLPSTSELDKPSDSHNSLFNHQNSQIRKALLDRKLSDQHKHLDSSSPPASSDKN